MCTCGCGGQGAWESLGTGITGGFNVNELNTGVAGECPHSGHGEWSCPHRSQGATVLTKAVLGSPSLFLLECGLRTLDSTSALCLQLLLHRVQDSHLAVRRLQAMFCPSRRQMTTCGLETPLSKRRLIPVTKLTPQGPEASK